MSMTFIGMLPTIRRANRTLLLHDTPHDYAIRFCHDWDASGRSILVHLNANANVSGIVCPANWVIRLPSTPWASVFMPSTFGPISPTNGIFSGGDWSDSIGATRELRQHNTTTFPQNEFLFDRFWAYFIHIQILTNPHTQFYSLISFAISI